VLNRGGDARVSPFFVGSGRGFHTGCPNKASLALSSSEGGVVEIGGQEHRVWGIGAAEARTHARCTSIEGIGPLEHLSAAAIALGAKGWRLDAEGPDLPLFDGSAKPWAEAFSALMPMSVPDVRPCSLLRGAWAGDRRGNLEIEPSSSFELVVEWTRGPDGPERWEGGAEDLVKILSARTFVEVGEWSRARAAGLLRGAGADCGRLLSLEGESDPDLLGSLRAEGIEPTGKIWTGGDERLPDECAAHKALDLVGDIGCAIGYLPALRIRARDAGHALHAELGRALRIAHRD
jgi:UDP-3-O-[3-hydroxymyristoyl] N-acetylglucosamine deacetylase